MTKKCDWVRPVAGLSQNPERDAEKNGAARNIQQADSVKSDAFNRRNAQNRHSSCAVVIHGRYTRQLAIRMVDWHLQILLAGFVGFKIEGRGLTSIFIKMGVVRWIFNVTADDQVVTVVLVRWLVDLVTLILIVRQVFHCDPF
ncbi:MAG: hypothetical protein ACYDHY_15165 [Acidiferrobacterales bacterium]